MTCENFGTADYLEVKVYENYYIKARLRCACSQLAPSPSMLQRSEDIWTTGAVLKAVNDISLYPDSKTYV